MSHGGDFNELQQKYSTALHFWDVFQHRSHKGEISPTFQMGMERQMEHSRGLYLHMAQYAPDIFGVQSSSAKNESNQSRKRMLPMIFVIIFLVGNKLSEMSAAKTIKLSERLSRCGVSIFTTLNKQRSSSCCDQFLAVV